MHHRRCLSEIAQPGLQRHTVAEVYRPLIHNRRRRYNWGNSTLGYFRNWQPDRFQQFQSTHLQPLDVHDVAHVSGKINLIGVHLELTSHPSHTMQTSTLAILLSAGMLWSQSLPRLAPAGLTFTVGNGKLLIRAVTPHGNAARAGLQPEDILLRVDGVPATPTGPFVRPILRRAAPASVRLTIERAGQPQDITLQYPEPPSESNVLYGALPVRDHLRRTLLTLPAGAGKHPAILFLPGSGCGSQESPSFFAPEVRILHALTAAGYATLRVEKSSVGDSEGPPCYSADADLPLDLETYRQALAFLRQHPVVNPERLFLFAHSAGATIAPLVARDEKLRGIILHGAMGTIFSNYVLAMRERMAKLGNQPPEKLELTRECLDRLLNKNQLPEDIVATQPACRAEVYFDSPPAYIAQWNAINLADVWRPLQTPVLLLYGQADFISSEAESRALFTKIKSRSKKLLILPMDHGFVAVDQQPQAWDIETGKRPSPGLYTPVIGHLRAWLDARH